MAVVLPIIFLQVMAILWFLGAIIYGVIMFLDVTINRAKVTPLLGMAVCGLVTVAMVGAMFDFLT